MLWDLSGGRLGTTAIGMPVLELVTKGNKSGLERRVLITYVETDSGPALAGTNAGSPNDPAWVRNLRATPDARIRRLGKWQNVTARWWIDAERDRVWSLFLEADDGYEAYEQMLERPIPIAVLEPAETQTSGMR